MLCYRHDGLHNNHFLEGKIIPSSNQQQEDNNHEPAAGRHINDLRPVVSVIQETSKADHQAYITPLLLRCCALSDSGASSCVNDNPLDHSWILRKR